MKHNYRLMVRDSIIALSLVTYLSPMTAAQLEDTDQGIILPIFSNASQITDVADLIDDHVYNKCQNFVAESPSSSEYGNYLTDCLTSSAIVGATRSYVLTRRTIYDLLNKRMRDAKKCSLEACSGATLIRRTDFIIVLRRLAWISQHQNDRIDAIKYYKLAKEWTREPKVSIQCDVEITALYLELAKGEGSDPIEPIEYPTALTRVRNISAEVINSVDARQDQKLLADLLSFESYYFEGRYDSALTEGRRFYEKWSDIDLKTALEKKLLHTGKSFLMQSEYINGNDTQALDLAESILSDQDAAENHFRSKDVHMYADSVKLLLLEKTGQTAAANSLKVASDAKYGVSFTAITNGLRAKTHNNRIIIP